MPDTKTLPSRLRATDPGRYPATARLLLLEAADRIEELEAELGKILDALVPLGASPPDA